MLDDNRVGLSGICFNKTRKTRGEKARVKARGGEHWSPLAVDSVDAAPCSQSLTPRIPALGITQIILNRR